MRFVTVEAADRRVPGLLLGEPANGHLRVLDLAKVCGVADLVDFIAAGPAALATARAASGKAEAALTLPTGALRAPIPRPRRNVFCVGRNYIDHIAEGDRTRGIQTPLPQHPQFFTKPPSTVIGPGANIETEAAISTKIDYEIELAVVIGRRGRNLQAADAMGIVFGYTIGNDVTARDMQRRHDQWFKGKGLDTFCPLGPWIVAHETIGDPQALNLSLSVNGQMRQSSNTSSMLFRIDRIIAELSQGMTLEPGDIILTGTPPGVGYAMDPPQFLKPGDAVECRIDGIGVLANNVLERRPGV